MKKFIVELNEAQMKLLSRLAEAGMQSLCGELMDEPVGLHMGGRLGPEPTLWEETKLFVSMVQEIPRNVHSQVTINSLCG